MTEQDTRVQCTTCANYRAARCHNACAAQLSHVNSVIEVGTTLAAMPQHCNGHKQKGQK